MVYHMEDLKLDQLCGFSLSLSPSPIVWLGAPCLVHSCLASQLIHPDQPQVRLVSWAPDQNHKDCLENIFSFPTVREGWKLMHHGWFSYWKIGTFQHPICNHHSTRHVPYTILSACVCVCVQCTTLQTKAVAPENYKILIWAYLRAKNLKTDFHLPLQLRPSNDSEKNSWKKTPISAGKAAFVWRSNSCAAGVDDHGWHKSSPSHVTCVNGWIIPK